MRTPSPRHLAGPRRSWRSVVVTLGLLGLVAGALVGVAAMARNDRVPGALGPASSTLVPAPGGQAPVRVPTTQRRPTTSIPRATAGPGVAPSAGEEQVRAAPAGTVAPTTPGPSAAARRTTTTVASPTTAAATTTEPASTAPATAPPTTEPSTTDGPETTEPTTTAEPTTTLAPTTTLPATTTTAQPDTTTTTTEQAGAPGGGGPPATTGALLPLLVLLYLLRGVLGQGRGKHLPGRPRHLHRR